MKIASRQPGEDSSTLMVTLVTTSIMGFLLAGYLDLVRSEHLATLRSYYWNSALPIVEAGLEEALTQLHYNPTNLSANGWQFTNGVYLKERSLGGSKYSVSLSTDTPPVIISRGFTTVPSDLVFIRKPRAVKVTVTNSAVFTKALVARGQIVLNGTIRSDSFDSMDPNYSTRGLYDPLKYKDKGDIASNGTQDYQILANGGLKIYGHVSTGPGGTMGMRGTPAVGSKPFIDGGHTGIQTGWFRDDMNLDFPDVPVPDQRGLLVPGQGEDDDEDHQFEGDESHQQEDYKYILGGGNYELLTLDLRGNDTMLVKGNAVLYVPGYVNVSGNASIVIAPNACLQLFVGGATATFSGNGVVAPGGNATNFFYYGLPSNRSISLSGNAGFTGVIYAPQAALTMNGGGGNNMDFVGAAVANTVSMNGHFNFHYDENLGRTGPWRGFIITSWNEVFSMEEL